MIKAFSKKITSKDKYIHFFKSHEVQEIKEKGFILISKQSDHHIRNVLRKSSELTLVVSDGKGAYSKASLTPDKRLRLLEEWSSAPIRKPKVSLMSVPIKKQKMDWLMQKVSELGVDTIYLIQSNYQEKKNNLRYERAQIIIENACRQAQNYFLPKIIQIEKNIIEITQQIDDSIYYFWGDPITSVLISTLPLGENIQHKEIIFINGPEGGWSNVEKECLSAAFPCVSFSDQTLRSETAAICSLFYVKLQILNNSNL